MHTTHNKTDYLKENWQIQGSVGPKGAADEKLFLIKSFYNLSPPRLSQSYGLGPQVSLKTKNWIK